MWRAIILQTILPIVGLTVFPLGARGQGSPEMEVALSSGSLTGIPIHWGPSRGAILRTDGQIEIFTQSEVRDHRLLTRSFQPQSLAAARAELQAEMGSGYETVVAGPYVIAAPSGSVKRWQDTFLNLYSGFQRYFEVRGWRLRSPDFPLRVVVFKNRQAFIAYAISQSGEVPASVVGCYFPRSNRCALYQISGTSGTDWRETEATIMHEAAHQLAYNIGMHERLFENPLWFVEGLACMFEVPAVYSSRVLSNSVVERFSQQRVDRLRPYLKDSQQLAQSMIELVRDDRLFQSNPQLAYDLSWAMNFYLAERMPREYRDYVQLQMDRKFEAYGAAERYSDFQDAMGIAPQRLARDLQRLLGG
jgi:hypothetical protein